MNTIPQLNLQSITKLPTEEFGKVNSPNSEIVVTTPHKGKILIPTIEGWLFKTEKDASDIIGQIRALEEEAREYLLDEWLKRSSRSQVQQET